MDILKELGIDKINYGSCFGGENWNKTENEGSIDSINPSNGEVIGKIFKCSENDYNQIISKSNNILKEWKMTPAPIRGQLILKMTNALREKKDLLGSLVAMEMGKIKAEVMGKFKK